MGKSSPLPNGKAVSPSPAGREHPPHESNDVVGSAAPHAEPPLERNDLLAHLTSIVEACEDALTSTALDGTIVVWNPRAEVLYGYSAAEVIGRPISLILPRSRPGETDALLARIASGARISYYETVRLRKDGTPVEVSLQAFPVRDSSGTIIGAAAVTRDITEKKRLERDMHRWRDHLRAIAQGVDEAVVVRKPSGGVVYANDHAARLLGFTSVPELVGSSVAEIQSRFEFYTEAGELIPRNRLPGILALQGTETPPVVLRFHSLITDEERWAVVKSVPIRDDEGRVEFAASIFSDITERKKAEEALKASELRFQAFMGNSPIVAFIKDLEARFVYVNPQFERAFGVKAEDIIGVSDTRIVPPDVAEQIHRDDAEVLSTGKLKEITEVIPAPDGGQRHWLTFKFPITLPVGSPAGALGPQRLIAGASIDITGRVQAEEALKESEARFQAFMQNAPIVACMKDEAGKVVFVNQAWEQLFGIPISDALGKSDHDLQPRHLAEQFRASDREVLETGEIKVRPETVTSADGTQRHWLTFRFPIVLPSGARYVAAASVEITERVQAQEELQRYADRLQTLSRQLIEAQELERLRISRDLHDQVGQSLTAIKIDLQLAQHQAAAANKEPKELSHVSATSRTGEDGSHAEFIGRLGKSIEMVERTIQQVREFSLDLRPSILDDLGLPSALLWYVEEQARRMGFQTEVGIEQLKTRLSPELEIICFRVAQEAITNIVRHAHASRVSVELRKSGGSIVLTVKDNGAGFDSQILSSGTLDQNSNSNEPGSGHGNGLGEGRAPAHGSGQRRDAADSGNPNSGASKAARQRGRISILGLTGMSERVYLAGGTLSIESAPGAGTTVRAVFPLAPGPEGR
jgi:PAS domain S-box-containing protein